MEYEMVRNFSDNKNNNKNNIIIIIIIIIIIWYKLNGIYCF